jgi:hypothetical protein
MTHIAELRKDPRPAETAPEAQPPRARQLPSTRISPHVLKVLGLQSAEIGPADALTAD